jgi:hypothetical protein
MRSSSPLLITLALALAVAAPVHADCASGTCIPGGGPTATDCTAEFFGAGLLLNYPPYVPADPQPKTELRCYEGDAGCDGDGRIDGVCTFNVNVCLAASDPVLADCSVSSVDKVKVKAKGVKVPELNVAAANLVPTSAPACTTGQTVRVALKGKKKQAKATVKMIATGSAGKDKDALKLRCLRRDWPTHGFDHQNHRATPYETKIGPDNVASLRPAWAFRVDEQTPDWILNGVTATPTMGHGLLFVPAWNNTLYALSPKTEKIRWSYQGDGGIGIHSSAGVTADGRVIIVDGVNVVHCLDGAAGRSSGRRRSGRPAATTSGRRHRSPTTACSSGSPDSRTRTPVVHPGVSLRSTSIRAPSSGSGAWCPPRCAAPTRRLRARATPNVPTVRPASMATKALA